MASTGNYEKGLAAYKSGDYATALREFRPLAKQGLASAQSSLGWMYYGGQGVTQNDKTALKWYRLAAEQGDAPAQYSLGVMYENGLGVPQDDKTALKLFTLSAKGKNEYAQSEVNRLQKKIAITETTSSKKSKKKSKQPSVSIADDDPFKIPSFLDRTGDSPPPVQEVSPPAPEKKSAKPEEVSPEKPKNLESERVKKYIEKGKRWGRKATKALGPVGLGLTAYELLGAEAKAGERINKEAAQILIDAGLAVPELVADVLKEAFVPTEMGDATLKNVYEQEFKKPELSESREAVIVKKRPTGRLDFPTDNEKSFMSDW